VRNIQIVLAAAHIPVGWIAKLHLQTVMLSLAADEIASDPEVRTALQGYNLLRTDRNGWIELRTDGVRL
jgi:hypothetical protein